MSINARPALASMRIGSCINASPAEHQCEASISLNAKRWIGEEMIVRYLYEPEPDSYSYR